MRVDPAGLAARSLRAHPGRPQHLRCERQAPTAHAGRTALKSTVISHVINPGTESEASAILGSDGTIDEFTGIAGEIGIRNVPTQLLVKDGQVVAGRSGVLSSAALAALVSNAAA